MPGPAVSHSPVPHTRRVTRLLATVDVPASTANLGSGFDCWAAALSLRLRADLYETDEAGITVISRGEGARGTDAEQELIVRAFRDGLRVARGSTAGSGAWRIEISSLIPPARGLGSSAAVIVAGILLAVAAGRHRPEDDALVGLATRIEGHPDNVAAAFHGGMTLSVQETDSVRVRRFDPPLGWIPVLFIPERLSPTAEMRAALPETIAHADAVRAAGRAALLTAAIATGDATLLRSAMDDVLHQPHRLPLLDGTRELIDLAYRAGAAGAALSGAGPSVLAICDSPAIAHAVEDAFNGVALPGMAARLRFDGLGARVTEGR